jgi:hypothetical protein
MIVRRGTESGAKRGAGRLLVSGDIVVLVMLADVMFGTDVSALYRIDVLNCTDERFYICDDSLRTPGQHAFQRL